MRLSKDITTAAKSGDRPGIIEVREILKAVFFVLRVELGEDIRLIFRYGKWSVIISANDGLAAQEKTNEILRRNLRKNANHNSELVAVYILRSRLTVCESSPSQTRLVAVSSRQDWNSLNILPPRREILQFEKVKLDQRHLMIIQQNVLCFAFDSLQ